MPRLPRVRRRPARQPRPAGPFAAGAGRVGGLRSALENRALLSAVTVSAADNDASGNQTVVLADDVTAVTVQADGAYAVLTINADAVLADLTVTLAAGVNVTGQLWVESDDAGSGAVTLRRTGGGAVAFAGELRFRGNGGGDGGPGDALPDLTLGSASLVLRGDATVGAVVADEVFVEAQKLAAASVGAVIFTGAGLADFTAEHDARLTLSTVDATGGGDVRVRALDATSITAGAITVGDGGEVELISAEVTTFTAGDVTAGAGGTVNLTATDGGRLTVGDVTTGPGTGGAVAGGVAVRTNFGAVVRAGGVTTGGDLGVLGVESGVTLLGDVDAAGTVAVGTTDFAATQLGAVAANAFAVDVENGPVVFASPAIRGAAAIRADGDVLVRGTAGDDSLNLLNWDVIVGGTLAVESFGGDDFIRLGFVRGGTFTVGGLEVFAGAGTDVVRTDRLTVRGRAGVLFGGTGTLAAWYGSAGAWTAVAGSGNTRATFALGAVEGNVTLTGGRGRDALVLTGQAVGGRVFADAGAGRDTVVLRNGASAGSVVALGGDDTDSLSLVDSDVAGDVQFDSGDAADRVSVARANVGGRLLVRSGGGNDQVRIMETVAPRVDVRSEGGRDRVRVQTSQIADRLFVHLGDDRDRLDLDARTARADVVRLRGGADFDRLVDGPEEHARQFEKIVNRA